jgi:hypothetical protein
VPVWHVQPAGGGLASAAESPPPAASRGAPAEGFESGELRCLGQASGPSLGAADSESGGGGIMNQTDLPLLAPAATRRGVATRDPVARHACGVAWDGNGAAVLACGGRVAAGFHPRGVASTVEGWRAQKGHPTLWYQRSAGPSRAALGQCALMFLVIFDRFESGSEQEWLAASASALSLPIIVCTAASFNARTVLAAGWCGHWAVAASGQLRPGQWAHRPPQGSLRRKRWVGPGPVREPEWQVASCHSEPQRRKGCVPQCASRTPLVVPSCFRASIFLSSVPVWVRGQ